MRHFLLSFSLFFISHLSLNAALSVNDCTTPRVMSDASEITSVFLRMRHDLLNLEMPGIPSSLTVEQCELSVHERLYIIEGRLRAGCFLGSLYQLLIKETAPRSFSDNFRYEMEFTELDDN